MDRRSPAGRRRSRIIAAPCPSRRPKASIRSPGQAKRTPCGSGPTASPIPGPTGGAGSRTRAGAGPAGVVAAIRHPDVGSGSAAAGTRATSPPSPSSPAKRTSSATTSAPSPSTIGTNPQVDARPSGRPEAAISERGTQSSPSRRGSSFAQIRSTPHSSLRRARARGSSASAARPPPPPRAQPRRTSATCPARWSRKHGSRKRGSPPPSPATRDGIVDPGDPVRHLAPGGRARIVRREPGPRRLDGHEAETGPARPFPALGHLGAAVAAVEREGMVAPERIARRARIERRRGVGGEAVGAQPVGRQPGAGGEPVGPAVGEEAAPAVQPGREPHARHAGGDGEMRRRVDAAAHPLCRERAAIGGARRRGHGGDRLERGHERLRHDVVAGERRPLREPPARPGDRRVEGGTASGPRVAGSAVAADSVPRRDLPRRRRGLHQHRQRVGVAPVAHERPGAQPRRPAAAPARACARPARRSRLRRDAPTSPHAERQATIAAWRGSGRHSDQASGCDAGANAPRATPSSIDVHAATPAASTAPRGPRATGRRRPNPFRRLRPRRTPPTPPNPSPPRAASIASTLANAALVGERDAGGRPRGRRGRGPRVRPASGGVADAPARRRPRRRRGRTRPRRDRRPGSRRTKDAGIGGARIARGDPGHGTSRSRGARRGRRAPGTSAAAPSTTGSWSRSSGTDPSPGLAAPAGSTRSTTDPARAPGRRAGAVSDRRRGRRAQRSRRPRMQEGPHPPVAAGHRRRREQARAEVVDDLAVARGDVDDRDPAEPERRRCAVQRSSPKSAAIASSWCGRTPACRSRASSAAHSSISAGMRETCGAPGMVS